MHGLPSNVNLDFFIKKTFLQMCIGANDLILNFDNDVSITVTSSIGCLDSTGKIHKGEDFLKIAPILGLLLNCTVVSVKGDKSGTLKLEFDNGGKLEIYDDSEQYESYIIKNGEQIIVV
jgi:hypothetical protein